MTAAGRNDRSIQEFATVDWMAYQGAPDGGVAGKSRISQWWTGSQCKEVNLPQVIVYFVSIFWKCTWRLIFIIIIYFFFLAGGGVGAKRGEILIDIMEDGGRKKCKIFRCLKNKV